MAGETPIKKGFKKLKPGKSICLGSRTFKELVPDAVISQLNLKDWLFLGGPKEPTKAEKLKLTEASNKKTVQDVIKG